MSLSFNEHVDRAHRTASIKGFHFDMPDRPFDDARHVLSWLMLITTEVAEAAEEVRRGDFEKFSEELADICIRVFDVAGACNVNLEQEIINKMSKNEKRPERHGGKRA